jgi:formiminotetrahydrofolate cyclodeaminase
MRHADVVGARHAAPLRKIKRREHLLQNLTVKEYLARTASGDPVPGGGSAAALNAALAAALTEMVARLTIGRKNFEKVDAPLGEAAEQAALLRQKMVAMIDGDSDAYARVLAAYQLPKGTAEEKGSRARAIEEALKGAALVPLEVARAAAQIMDIARVVIGDGNPNALSDGAAGLLAARMAARAALCNVRINLAAIKDRAFTDELRQEAGRLEATVEAKEKEVLSLVKL